MPLLHDSFILLAISQLVTTCLYFLLHHRTRSGLLFILLFVCLICYVGYQHSALDNAMARLLYAISLLTPIVLYAIARYLFIDEARMKPVDWVLLAYFIMFREGIGGLIYNRATVTSDVVLITAYIIPLAILIYFSVMAALYTMQGYRADLLENRRTLRVYFVISTLVFIIPRLLSGLFVYGRMLLEDMSFVPVTLPGLVSAIYIFLIFLAFNLLIFHKHADLFALFTGSTWAGQPKKSSLPSTAATVTEKQATEPAAPLASGIIAVMEQQRLYAQHGFTIANLAQTLEVSEQKLRRSINSEMQFRNFNQFLNHYRLAEASKLLKQSDAPVSTIAYEVGYSTLSSFNSLFKSQFGMTPTEYRLAK
ncbi:MAG: helix-turn-helix transcriptional regulator [Gammaproteobacteria bacterium]